MTRYVIDAATLLHLVAEGVQVSPKHQIVAPNLIRSQALSPLLEAVHRGDLTEEVALQRHERLTELTRSVRYLPQFRRSPTISIRRSPTRGEAMETQSIPGYAFGMPEVARSPVSGENVELLKATLLWSYDDDRYLRMAGDVLADQVDDVLELWYGYVGSHPHLVHYFTAGDGQPIGEYLERVRARFAQWVRDVCERPHDDAWRDYQHEIALRHTRVKKNQTDAVDSVPEIALRYLVAFIFPITATMRSFLAGKGHGPEDVEGMHTAWFKAVVLHVCLWSQPYAAEAW